jgi:ERF superfamily
MVDTVKVPAIYGAIANVQAGLANIPKNGVMKFGATSYTYLKADDVQEAINPLLNSHGVIVRPEYTVETLTRGRGEGAPYVYVSLALTYVAVEDGSEFTVRSVGESAATDDKSINKALTQAIKNAHRVTFQFASGEPEPDDVPAVSSPAVPRKSVAEQKIDAARSSSTDNEWVSKIKALVGKSGKTDPETGEVYAELSGAQVTAVAKSLHGDDAGAWKSDLGKSQQVFDAIVSGVRK